MCVIYKTNLQWTHGKQPYLNILQVTNKYYHVFTELISFL